MELRQLAYFVAVVEEASFTRAAERMHVAQPGISAQIRQLEKEFGHVCKHKRMRLPGMASDIAWLADKTLQGLGLYHQKIHVLSEMNKTIACSVARAERELGYKPTIALEEGMRRSLKWCAENGQKF